jgi:putative ABC transport system permease protein
VGAGLLARAFHGLTRSDPGFDGGGTLTFEVPLDPTAYGDSDRILEFEARFRHALTALPGVEAVGAADVLPLHAEANQRPVAFPNAPANTGDADEDAPLVDWIRVGPGYAEAVGLRVLQGRAFRENDRTDGEAVALIDGLLARRFYPGADPVGATLATGGITARIVGVVDQARLYTVHSDDRPQVYVPMDVDPTASLSFVVRASGDASGLVPALRAVLEELDPQLPLTAVRPMDEIVRDALGRERLSLTLLVAFALGALLLAALGLYGVVANTVTRRTHEMGVRMALGADRRRVVGMVLGQGLRLATLGLVVGIAGAVALAPALETLTVGLRASDPWVYLGVVACLLGVTVTASLMPARRATRIDPVEALRAE